MPDDTLSESNTLEVLEERVFAGMYMSPSFVDGLTFSFRMCVGSMIYLHSLSSTNSSVFCRAVGGDFRMVQAQACHRRRQPHGKFLHIQREHQPKYGFLKANLS